MKRIQDIVEFLQEFYCKNHWRMTQEDSRAFNRTISTLRNNGSVIHSAHGKQRDDDVKEIDIDLDGPSALEIVTGIEDQNTSFNRQPEAEWRKEW